MRCRIGDKKLKKYRRKYGLPFVYGDCRGNGSNIHWLHTADGREFWVDRKGNIGECTKPCKVNISQELIDHWAEESDIDNS